MKRLLFLFSLIGLGVFFTLCIKSFSHHQNYLHIPVSDFGPLGIPIIRAEIEGISCSLAVDLGLSHMLGIQPKIVQKIKNKKMNHDEGIKDIKDNIYTTQSFQLSSVQLKNWSVKDVIAFEEVSAYKNNTIFFAPSEEVKQRILDQDAKVRDGTLGWPIFSRFDCFFDLGHSEIFIGNSRAALSKAGCSMNGFIKVPFTITNSGLILSVTTDLGIHPLLLDTGATCSMIRESLVDKRNAKEIESDVWEYNSDSLQLNGHDLGTWTFRLFKIPNSMTQFDGALGMDFFRDHAIYFDFRNQAAYIQP